MSHQIELGGISEVSGLLGVSRQRVTSLRSQPAFPKPIAELASGPIFDLGAIRRWAGSTNRKPGRPPVTPSRVVGARYLLEDQPIGEGGFGKVFKATDRQGDAEGNLIVAVKLLMVDQNRLPVDLDRFRREQRLLSQHQHPNVVSALDYGEESDGTLWYAMPLAKGNLESRIPLLVGDLPAALDIVRQVAAGLEHLHENGIIHRDVKPGNVLQLHGGIWAVSDLGLARRHGSHSTVTLTETGEGLGTLWYSAPEQWVNAKSVTHAADIYGIGRILHILLTGQEGDPADIEHEGIRAIVRRATESAPSRRYSSVRSFLKALGDAASSPAGSWRTKKEEMADLQQRLAERLRTPFPDPSAVLEVKQMIDASIDEDELLSTLDEIVPYLTLETILGFWNEDPGAWRDFLDRMAEQMRHCGYGFEFTDQIGAFFDRCLTASESDSEVMRSSVFALIGVGTRHNRWRVRDIVASILQKARTPAQALAVAEAIRSSDDYDVNWSIQEIDLATLHPIVNSAIEEVQER